MIGDLIRVRMDEKNDELVIELKDGTAAKQVPLPSKGPHQGAVILVLDENGYVLNVRVTKFAEALAD